VRTVEAARRERLRWRKLWRERRALSLAAQRGTPIVKCIRANLMLPWLVERCQCRVLLVIRHPAPVVESRLRLGHRGAWDPEPVLNRYRQDECLHQLTRDRYREILSRPLGRVEALTLNWVIENQWPIEYARKAGVAVTFYEHLRASHHEWQRIVGAMDLDRAPSADLLAKPSQQASEGTAHVTSDGHVPSWKRRLTAEQLESIQRILDETGFGVYDTGDAMPRVDARSCGATQVTGRAQ